MARDVCLLSIMLYGCALLSAISGSRGVDAGRLVLASAWFIGNLVLLAGGCLLHARWRLTQQPAMGWLAAAFIVYPSLLVPLALVDVTDADHAWAAPVAAPLDLVTAFPVVVMSALAARKVGFPRALNPIAVAALLAVPCVSLAFAWAALGQPPIAVSHGLTTIAVVLAAVALARLAWLRATHRLFLALGAAGLAVAHDFHNVASVSGPQPDPQELVVGAVTVLSSVLIVVLTLGLFRRAVDLRARRLVEYQARAEAAEEMLRREEELMHEVRATMAGISTATYVLHGDLPMTPTVSEHELRAMIDAEVGRVQRLLDGERSDARGPVRIDLDELLQPQVIAQRALGHDLRWQRSGLVAFGQPDNVAEAVHVVLTNATRYADGGPVFVHAIRWGGKANITITDSGPGVPRHLRPVIFERGAQEDGSPGMGVGLYLAKRALERDGGSIRLQHCGPLGGATFVISLRRAFGVDR